MVKTGFKLTAIFVKHEAVYGFIAFHFHVINKLFVVGSILVEYSAVHFTIETRNFRRSFLYRPSELECFLPPNPSNLSPYPDSYV